MAAAKVPVERIWIKLVRRCREEGTLDEGQCLLANRGHFTPLRIERHNTLPLWDWDERPRRKRKSVD